MYKIVSVLLILAVAITYFVFGRNQTEIKNEAVITVEEVREHISNEDEVVLLDVRTEAEFNGPLGHLQNAILIPINELEQRSAELDSLKDRKVVVYCRSGNRSNFGTKILRKKGFDAVNMIGGMIAYNKLPEK